MGCPKVLHRALLTTVLGVTAAALSVGAQEQVRATFRSSLDLVSIAVIVRDGGGRLVTGLNAQDFEVVDAGIPRPVTHFETGRDADARLALLVDSSGSMVVGAKPDRTRMAADFLIARMRPADAATVFSFDSEVRRLTPYTGNSEILRSAVSSVVPFGSTCLFDAIVGTARTRAGGRAPGPSRRAADGRHRHGEPAILPRTQQRPRRGWICRCTCSAWAAWRGQPAVSTREGGPAAFSVAELARRTGGLSAEASSPAQLSVVTQTILDELHHQYRDRVRRRQPAWLALAAGAGP